ncbi:MAG TPA: hypothetical protein VN229_19695 [Terriglobales bacterium]|nr:hypothetical protein [Terriglobales bacterium]
MTFDDLWDALSEAATWQITIGASGAFRGHYGRKYRLLQTWSTYGEEKIIDIPQQDGTSIHLSKPLQAMYYARSDVIEDPAIQAVLRQLSVEAKPEAAHLRRKADYLMERSDIAAARPILEQIFDGRDAAVANELGYIHSRHGSTEFDPDKAIAYFAIAAKDGDTYAQHQLGGIFRRRGDIAEAIKWYRLASQGGSAQCSYNLYRLLRDSGDAAAAAKALLWATKQGHPVARRIYAVECLRGTHGIAQMPAGLIRLTRNMPALYWHKKKRKWSEENGGAWPVR